MSARRLLEALVLVVLSAPAVACGNAASRATGPPPPPPADAVVLAREDGDNALTLAVESKHSRLTVFNGEGLGVDGLHVRIAGAATSSCGSGCYEAETSARGGIPVVVSGRSFAFHVPRGTPDATALVRRATRVFRALRSVAFVERLASSPRNHIVSTFTLEAPNRVEYRIHGGVSGIVIGTTRWDRTNGKWTRSASTILPQPAPVWGSHVTNAHVLARTRDGLVVSFLNPDIPAWFTIRFDRSTLRPQVVDMTATAHFMHHRYTAFNFPRHILPPS